MTSSSINQSRLRMSAVGGHAPTVEEAALWLTELRRHFEEPYATEYAESVKRECLSVRQLLRCTTDDLKELGVRMGHRAKLASLAEEFCLEMTKRAALLARQSRKKRMQVSSESQQQALRLGLAATHRFSRTQSAISPRSLGASDGANRATESQLIMETLSNQAGVEWVNSYGSSPSLESFLSSWLDLLTTLTLDANTFIRLFHDNKPMPFAEFVVSPSGGPTLGLLLRIPDVGVVDGTSLTVVTNRFVVLISLDDNLIVSYQRSGSTCPLVQGSFRSEWEEDVHQTTDIGSVLEAMLRNAFRAYEVGTGMLREAMDEVNAVENEVNAVHQLTAIAKRAAIFLRCASADREAMEQLLVVDGFELLQHHVRAVCERLQTVESLCSEMEANALSSIDVNIALSDFRSSTNLKIFTYITMLSQPIALATGWYGMNFEMPEMGNPDAYYIFTPVVWVVALSLMVFLFWREKNLLRLRTGVKEKVPSSSSLPVPPPLPPRGLASSVKLSAAASTSFLVNNRNAHGGGETLPKPVTIGTRATGVGISDAADVVEPDVEVASASRDTKPVQLKAVEEKRNNNDSAGGTRPGRHHHQHVNPVADWVAHLPDHFEKLDGAAD